MWTWLILGLLAIPLLSLLYIWENDKCLSQISTEALAISPTRYTPDLARSAAKQFAEHPVSVLDQMPKKTGRRYIVVGGVSLLHFPHL